MSLQPRYRKGDRIGGRYLVHQALLGGMGEVYLCLDLEQNYPYALKTFQARYLTNQRIRQLFAHEVGTWVALEQHPNIVRCFGLAMLDNQPFMVLEWAAGEEGRGADLRSWLRRGRLDVRMALDVTIDICRGLIHAQAKQPGIVHRDLKPDNILVTQGRVAKITDFGLASLVQQTGLELALEPSTSSRRQTMIGARGVVGTPPYMAPEQWRGEPGDVRTDIYAVGCILYEMLTGTQPYQATTLDGFQRLHTTAPPPVIPSKDSRLADLNPLLARCLVKQLADRFTDAVTLLDALTQLYRTQVGSEPRVLRAVATFTSDDYVSRGVTYERLGRLEDALADYEHAIALAPTDALVYYNRGVTYERLGRFEDALADYARAIALDPADAKVYANRGLTYAQMGRFEDALADYARAIALDPADANVYTNRGITYAQMGRLNDGLADQNHAIALDPADAKAYANRGNTYAQMGRFEDALADYIRVIALDPTDAQAYYNRGNTYAQMGRFEEALADYERTLALDPTSAPAYGSRGNTYAELGRFEEALADYERTLALDPTSAQTYANRGNIYAELGRFEEALTDQTHAIALDPTHVPAYYNRANTYADLGRVENALTDYIYVIELDSANVRAYVGLGTLLANQGKLRAALRYFEQAAQLGDPQGMVYAARVCQMLGIVSTEAINPVQQAFDVFQHAASPADLSTAAAQFPVMTDPQFIDAVEQAIAEQVPPERRPVFEQRLAWLRDIVQRSKSPPRLLGRLFGKKK
jgi:tetratricopeptide (TPR) repeat protein